MNLRENFGTLIHRFEGALLGTAVGDALGMPVEGWAREEILAAYGILDEMVDARLGRGTYTDDTEMMIALAESLLRQGGVEGNDIARSFLEHYHPNRGYGAGTTQVLRKLRSGIPWKEAAGKVFPGGSYGNGCAMRLAPIALFYFQSLDELKEAAMRQSEVTHAHPLAREGSHLQALSIALLLRTDSQKAFDPLAFIARLTEALSPESASFQKAYELIESFLRKAPEPREVIQRLGHDSRLIRSQPTALYSFLSHHKSFEEALVYAVNLGGDTDTIGAMTGALAGAYHGATAIPMRWLEVLENREGIRELARRLLNRATQKI